VWITVLCVTAAQLAITYMPPLQRIFDTRSVPLPDGLLIVGVGMTLFAVIEIEKQLRLHLREMRLP
jgi:hypothetical protein